MDVTATQPPAERFALIADWLKKAVAAAIAIHMPADLIVLIWKRINRVSLDLTRFATLLREGKYKPRQTSTQPRKKPTLRKPRQRSPLSPKAGWMLRLVPGVAGPRGWLETLLQAPDMQELLQAAPPTIVRSFRSLCHMLLIPPPPVLARRPTPPPDRPRDPPQEAAPAATPRASAPPDPPTQAEPAPNPAAFTPNPPPANACGPPLPA